MKKILIAIIVMLVVIAIAGVSLYFGLRNQPQGDQKTLIEVDSKALLFRHKKSSWCDNSGKMKKKNGIVVGGGGLKTCSVYFSWNGCYSEEDVCCIRGAVSVGDPENHIKRMMVCVKSLLVNNTRHHSEIPVYFGATARLRLLNITDANKTKYILDQVKSYLLRANLSVQEVGIISGRNESFYRWVAANYLRGVFKSESTKRGVTYGTMDLSEESAQISYDSTILRTQNFKLHGKTFDVFSQSNMCFGINTSKGRYQTFLIENVTKIDVEDPCYPKESKYEKNAVEMFWGICTHNRQFTETLRKQPNIVKYVYKFRGTGEPALCRKYISKIFDEKACERRAYRECFSKIKVPHHRIFLGYSEFYSTAAFLNVTSNSPAEFMERANSVCLKDVHELNKMTHVPKHIRFQLCFNAQYIVELLLNGYGFSQSTWKNIKFTGEVNRQDVTWTLGYLVDAVRRKQ